MKISKMIDILSDHACENCTGFYCGPDNESDPFCDCAKSPFAGKNIDSIETSCDFWEPKPCK